MYKELIKSQTAHDIEVEYGKLCSLFEIENDDLGMHDISINFDNAHVAEDSCEFSAEKSSWMYALINFYDDQRGYEVDWLRPNLVSIEIIDGHKVIEVEEAFRRMGL